MYRNLFMFWCITFLVQGCFVIPDIETLTDIKQGDCFVTKQSLVVAGQCESGSLGKLSIDAFYPNGVAPIVPKCAYIENEGSAYLKDTVVEIVGVDDCFHLCWFMVLNENKYLYVTDVDVIYYPAGSVNFLVSTEIPEHELEKVRLEYPLYTLDEERNLITYGERYLEKCR